jgi:hypothetical protein
MEWSTRSQRSRPNEPETRPSEARSRGGYPIWTLIDAWRALGESDEAVRSDFELDEDDWAEAKAYYAAHRDEIEARRTRDAEPSLAVPGAITLEDLFAARRLQA